MTREDRCDSGIVLPIAFAVVRLTTSSNLLGCSTGMSAALAPCDILSTGFYGAALQRPSLLGACNQVTTTHVIFADPSEISPLIASECD